MSEEEAKENGAEAEEETLAEPKSRPKLIRVLTVFAYVSSVSMAAILLSIYYIFMWDGQPSLARRTDPHTEQLFDYPPNSHQKNSGLYQHNLSEAALDADEFAKENNNYTLFSLEMEEKKANMSGIVMIEDSFSTTNTNRGTMEEKDKDRGNLKEAPKHTQEQMVKPTMELSTLEASSPLPREDVDDTDTVEEDIESPNLPETVQISKKMLSNKKFFYKNLILG